MPRGPRLDAPGTLHHVIVRGIEKKSIVTDDNDRRNFVTRMGENAIETGTVIYAWALMTNHAHLLIRSGNIGLPTYMRRFLTGYAVSYNKKHRRYGHLFQNRYKSIVCEEDRYFKELIRYIHLNPIRASIVGKIIELDQYKWSGHSVIVGNEQNKWQDRTYVLKWFGKGEDSARHRYLEFIKSGMTQGKRPELTGGGLVKSMIGWSDVQSLKERGNKTKGDERILGSTEFVSGILSHAGEKIKQQIAHTDSLKRVTDEIEKFCEQEGVTINILRSQSRRRPLPKIRKNLAKKLVYEYGLSLVETARQLGVSTSGISQMLRRK